MKNDTPRKTATAVMMWMKCAISRAIGVSPTSSPLAKLAIRPITVRSPVLITKPRAVPTRRHKVHQNYSIVQNKIWIHILYNTIPFILSRQKYWWRTDGLKKSRWTFGLQQTTVISAQFWCNRWMQQQQSCNAKQTTTSEMLNHNPHAAVHRKQQPFSNSSSSFWPYLAPIIISWWYLKQLKSYRVDK